MEIDLPHGPWTKIVSAQWGDRPLTLYVNVERYLLLTMFDKAGSETKGILVLMKKPVVLDGDTSKFAASQNRELTIIEKLSRDYHFKYLLIDSTPYYVPYSQAELFQAVRKQYAELSGLLKVVRDAGDAFHVKVTDLARADAPIVGPLLEDPFTLFGLSGTPPQPEGGAIQKGFRVEDMLLGTDSSGGQVTASLSSVSVSVILGGRKEDAGHLKHVLCENALLHKVPCMVFDSYGSFKGLAQPARDARDFESCGMACEPTGFPLKEYLLGKGLFVNLRFVDFNDFATLMGFGKAEDVKKVFAEAFPESASLDDLLAHLGEVKESRETPAYSIARAGRIVRVLQKRFPSTFGRNTFSELKAPWDGGVGQALYVDTSNQTAELKALTTAALLRELGKAPAPASLLVLVEGDAGDLPEGVKIALKELKAKGVGVVVSGAEQDVSFLGEPTLSLHLVGDQVVAEESGKEKKRFSIRPTYSLCTEFGPFQQEGPQPARQLLRQG